ncbi:uncharacterized protein EI97DRAFT_111374 [Westerdykella ornata]|uniref:Uncharacterized protein n=1 Tax=Westerdykella ornata TaxID=318751 RepID=A0A6A6JU12_WESOR|nr:uncharacterized protein EI97DRAFT_111374 [Westerdykella ornata]KAF2280110.1 hypothetical protein EI97DRAFT_111374 [Westerdykella ornata]
MCLAELNCEFCPFCAAWNITPAEYRLIGNDVTPAVGGLTRVPSLTLAATRRETRRGTVSRTESTNNTITMMASEKNKAMNARVEAYLRAAPSETSPRPAPLQEVDDESELGITSSPSDTASEGQDSIRQPSTSSQLDRPNFLNRMRQRSRRLSRTIFK